ncbi:MAG: hypothetical protein ACOY82_20865 [Pseudomonadota bacterium]|jgi:hypothetical protein
MTYRSLDAEAIIATCARLHARIGERFPGAGLSKVAVELLAEARETTTRIADIRRPNWWIRGASGVALLAMLGLLGALAATATAPTSRLELFPLLQVIESAINDVIFLGIAVFFLSTLETRIKRRKSLRALHQLRSLAHVIDMHQLTKDPEHLMSPERDTPSSPERRLDRFQLARYLDYCTEMLAIISKIAALHAQDLDDPQVLGAVNDIQALTAGLSSNIGQKIVILDNLRMRDATG